jgi:hypothetical protein
MRGCRASNLIPFILTMNKPKIERCNRLLDDGFSLLTVGDGKQPNFSWKKCQERAYSKSDFEKVYYYNGGKTYQRDGETIEIQPTKGVGIVTGYNRIEVIDVDLKVFKTLKDQQDFWNEYTMYLKESIDDFEEKFVIYKTVNNGYHIIYKCEKVDGNIKIAKMQGMKEAVIESRGVGGYVWIYDNQVSKSGYDNVQEISIKDRDLLWEISRSFNYIEEAPSVPKEIEKTYHKNSGLKPWEDYNQQTRIWDLISHEFSVVKKLSDRIIIKRNGGTSSSSGSIFTKDNKMFLFTTGTQYPNEKPLSPFDIFTINNHHGDYSKAASDLYAKNYGDRVVKDEQQKERIEIIKEEMPIDMDFPLEVFPKTIRFYMTECHKKLNSNIDYMGCSFLWMLSVIIGNSVKIKVKEGWIETGIVWISLVGEPGIGKTPSAGRIISPLKKINSQERRKYNKQYAKYEAYQALDKKEQKNHEEVRKPNKSDIIASDFTVEGLNDLHEQNPNSVGIFVDELAGWFKDMNKYRAGSDLEFWLSSWSNEGISQLRKTSKGSFVESPILPILGGIQPKILIEHFSEQNKDNGFIDRMLTTYPDARVDEWCDADLDEHTISWYNDWVVDFYNEIRRKVIKLDSDGEILSVIASMSTDAREEWVKIFNGITAIQNSDFENEYMKSMFPKQKSYIPRFALLLNTLAWFDEPKENSLKVISKESIEGAKKLSDYFIKMAKKHKIISGEQKEIKDILRTSENKTTTEKIEDLFKKNPNIKVSQVASVLGISRVAVYKHLKK